MNKELAKGMKVVALDGDQTGAFAEGATGVIEAINKCYLQIKFTGGTFSTKDDGSTSWWARYDQVKPVVKSTSWTEFEKRYKRFLLNSHYGMLTDSEDEGKPKVDGLEMNWDEIISIVADAFDSASKKMVELEKSLEYNVKQFVDHGESDKKTILNLTEKLQKTRKEREKLDNLYSKVQRFSTIHHALNDETFTDDEKDTIVKLTGQFIVSTSGDLVKFVLLYGSGPIK